MKRLFILPLMMLALLFTACESEPDADDYDDIEEPVEMDDMENEETIADMALEADNLTTLVAALQAADLLDMFEGPGPFTVFAPTDEAFEALPEGTLDELLEPENREQLSNILQYHVVSGSVMAADVMGMDSATTVGGSDIAISVNGETVMINDATVSMADLVATNGVIHIIDTVLMPPADM